MLADQQKPYILFVQANKLLFQELIFQLNSKIIVALYKDLLLILLYILKLSAEAEIVIIRHFELNRTRIY